MSTYTPLMADTKADPSLPMYRIDESNEELVVGRGPCSWVRRMKARCAARCAERRALREANGCARSRCVLGVLGRIVKWVFALALFFGVARFFVLRHIYATHPADCVPINSTTTTISLPLASDRTGVYLHPSLVTGNTHIIHSTDAQNGTILVSFDLARDPELAGVGSAEELFVCSIAKPRGVGIGIFTRDRKSAVPAVRFTTVEIPEGVATPPVSLLSAAKHRCMRKALRKHIVDPAIARFDAKHADVEYTDDIFDDRIETIDEEVEIADEEVESVEDVQDVDEDVRPADEDTDEDWQPIDETD
jgi:hypothetical protein